MSDSPTTNISRPILGYYQCSKTTWTQFLFSLGNHHFNFQGAQFLSVCVWGGGWPGLLAHSAVSGRGVWVALWPENFRWGSVPCQWVVVLQWHFRLGFHLTSSHWQGLNSSHCILFEEYYTIDLSHFSQPSMLYLYMVISISVDPGLSWQTENR